MYIAKNSAIRAGFSLFSISMLTIVLINQLVGLLLINFQNFLMSPDTLSRPDRLKKPDLVRTIVEPHYQPLGVYCRVRDEIRNE